MFIYLRKGFMDSLQIWCSYRTWGEWEKFYSYIYNRHRKNYWTGSFYVEDKKRGGDAKDIRETRVW